MCAPVVAAIAVGSAIYSAVQQNQQTQHAKGASEAQATAAAAQQAQATKIGPAQTATPIDQSATIAAATAKRKAAMAAGIQSTIGAQGTQGAPPSLVSQPQAFATGVKTALGA